MTGGGERGGEGRGGEGRSGATTKKNAHWELRENNNCASVLYYSNFFLISIEKKIANALRIKRERQKEKQLFSSLKGKNILPRNEGQTALRNAIVFLR